MLYEVWTAVLGRAALQPWILVGKGPLLAVWVTAGTLAAGGSVDEARIAAVTAARESGGDPHALSPDGLDCGLMQLRGVARRGHACAEFYANPALAVAVWIDDLHDLQQKCGATPAALGALATGKCGGAPVLVARRCALAGGCPP